jgi:hypothetical protein
MVSSNWHGYDMHGALAGTGFNGYVFGMEAWYGAGQIVPMVRYDPRYAEVIGKYILHLANNSRYFFPDEWDENHQSYSKYRNTTESVLPYEGMKKDYQGKKMYVAGDPSALRELWNLGPNATDLSLYSAAFVGVLGAIVSETNVPYILQLDVIATDFYKSNSYPTYLYYNPFATTQEVNIELETHSDLYDITSGKFIRKNVIGTISIPLLFESASLIVVAPGNSKLSYTDSQIKINDIFVGYVPEMK